MDEKKMTTAGRSKNAITLIQDIRRLRIFVYLYYLAAIKN